MTPADFVAATSDSFQGIGAVHYFHDFTREEAEALELDLFRFYFCGRGGVLGAVSAEVVQSAFGYFNPALLGKMWTTGAQRCDVSTTAAAQMQAAYRIGEADLAGIDGLAEAAATLDEITGAVDASGLTLFAGFQSLEKPESVAAQFMHQAVLMRELRGSAHLAALAATGCPSRAAHQIKRPDDQEAFGWTDTVEVSDQDRAAYEKAGQLTDEAMIRHVASIAPESLDHAADVAAQALAAVSG